MGYQCCGHKLRTALCKGGALSLEFRCFSVVEYEGVRTAIVCSGPDLSTPCGRSKVNEKFFQRGKFDLSAVNAIAQTLFLE